MPKDRTQKAGGQPTGTGDATEANAAPLTQAVVDSLLALVEAEGDSLLQRLREPLPALAKCSEHLREVLGSLEAARVRRDQELRALLKEHGVAAPPPRGPEPDSFFTLLSTRFLLLKVAEAQDLLKARYENAIAAMAYHPATTTMKATQAEVERHLADVQEGYDRLSRELKAMGLEPEKMP